jgi:hypothetical protein
MPGLAFLWAHVEGAVGEPHRSGIRGIGQSGELSAGGTPFRGLVVGGSLWTARIDPVFIESGHTVSPDDDSVKWTALRVGPFVDFYPDPARGFHATAALGLIVQFESDTKGDPLEPLAYGMSLATGAGYEWFVLSDVSLGFVGRFALGGVARSGRGVDETTLFVVPELALSATYH